MVGGFAATSLEEPTEEVDHPLRLQTNDEEIAERVLYALASDDGDQAAVRLREILSAGPVTDDDLHAEALGLLRESAALKKARETVRSYAEDARERLAPLPPGPARQAMVSLCDFIADRTS